MKKKNIILIFSLFLILFMSVSAISAATADNVTSELNHNDGNLKTIESDDLSYSSHSTNENILSENSTATTPSISFSELSNQIKHNSKITLDSDVVYKSGDSSDGITIGKNMVINGNGHTIDAKSKARLFRVGTGYSITLSNVNIINGYISGQSGGVILSSGTLKLTNCNFTNCNVVGSKCDGGAIAGSGAGTIINCNFDKCSATGYGGAASSNGLKFKNCNFTNNVASNGGAIGGTVYLYGCYFENCIATSTADWKNDDNGGGACNGYIPKVESSVFINCKAPKAFGGALRGTTNAYNCQFDNCIAREGGAVGGKGTYESCTFKKCVATSLMGGALFTEKTTINKCKFIECSATNSDGGAVFIGNNAKITNCKFIRCKAPKGCGGAVYGNGVIEKCVFEKNSAKFGGAVSSYSITVKGSTFTANKASKGGAAYNIKSLTSCTFNKNKATYGGAVCNAQNVISSKFGDNSAKFGAVSYNDVNVVFKNAYIKNTIKLIQGLFYNHKHKLTLTASAIVNTGKFTKFFNYNTGTFIYSKNTIKSSYKIKQIAGPRNIKR